MLVYARTVLISLKDTRMQSRIITVTAKVDQNHANLKLTVRLSRNMEAEGGRFSEK